MSSTTRRGSRKTPKRPELLTRRRLQVAISTVVALSLIAGWTMLAYSGARDPALPHNEKNAGIESIQAFNPSSPSKELVYAGARLVAQEEPPSCAPLLAPTYKSFAATPGTSGDNPSGGSISFTLGPTCSWTATSNANWITITSATSGIGSGSVNYSVGVNTSGTVRTGTITIGGQTYTVYQGQEFTDVPATPTPHIFYAFIGRLAARGVTVGCTSSTYCPDYAVLHEQMATFVMRAKGEPNPTPPQTQRFADVPIPPANPYNIFYAFIDRVDVLNIWNGCGTNQSGQRIYCPSSNVKREQMAAIMIRGIGELNPPTPPTQRFYDVPPSHPFYNFIDRMAALGITSGCGTGCNEIGMPCYCPASSTTRGQMAVFLVRAFNL